MTPSVLSCRISRTDDSPTLNAEKRRVNGPGRLRAKATSASDALAPPKLQMSSVPFPPSLSHFRTIPPIAAALRVMRVVLAAGRSWTKSLPASCRVPAMATIGVRGECKSSSGGERSIILGFVLHGGLAACNSGLKPFGNASEYVRLTYGPRQNLCVSPPPTHLSHPPRWPPRRTGSVCSVARVRGLGR